MDLNLHSTAVLRFEGAEETCRGKGVGSLVQPGRPRRGVILLAGILLAVVSTHAESEPSIAGTYRCTDAYVGAKKAPCGSPPLILRSDGSYRLQSDEGTYSVNGHWIVFSQSKKRLPARLRGAREIVFEYQHRGKKHRVTYQRKLPVPPGMSIV